MVALAPLLALAALAAAPPAKPPPRQPDLPGLIAERQQWCDRYRAARDDKKRRAVFASYAKAIAPKRAEVGGVAATVTSIEPSARGERLIVTVRTEFGDCSNDDVWHLDSAYHLARGSPTFDAVAPLWEGAAVTVWLANVKPWHNELHPDASVCGTRWLVQYVRVEPAAR
jgi:hypothetical protein